METPNSYLQPSIHIDPINVVLFNEGISEWIDTHLPDDATSELRLALAIALEQKATEIRQKVKNLNTPVE